MTYSPNPARLNLIEYRAFPGQAFRKKLMGMDPSCRYVLLALLVIAGTAVSIFLLGSIWTAALAIPFLALVSAAGILSFSRDQIAIGEHGIAFPVTITAPLRFRGTRLWKDVIRIEVISGDGLPETTIRPGGSAIKLHFRSGGHITLWLNRFTKDSLSAFLAALQEWATSCPRNNQLEHLPKLLEYELAGKTELSYTHFWEEDLQNSYSFTTFVPLPVDSYARSGDLKVLQQISAGGFSAIYQVFDESGQNYVLKESVIPNSVDDETRAKVKEHFRREAQILMKVSHDNIARVYDHFVENGRDYLLLEFIDGQDARTLLRHQKKVPVATVLKWAEDLCSVLSYLHSQSPPIVHRDVSPDNLVITTDNRVILIDFGAANEFVGEATGTLIGKQSYMPPEQIKGKCTPQSDIYSLGATIYFLLCGKDPEPLSCASPLKLRPDVPLPVDELVRACTRLDLSERFESCQTVLNKIKALTATVATAK